MKGEDRSSHFRSMARARTKVRGLEKKENETQRGKRDEREDAIGGSERLRLPQLLWTGRRFPGLRASETATSTRWKESAVNYGQTS